MIVQMKTEEANIYLLERFSYVAIEEQQNYYFRCRFSILRLCFSRICTKVVKSI